MKQVIFDPVTEKWHKLNTTNGIRLLKRYLKSMNGGASAPSDSNNSDNKKKIAVLGRHRSEAFSQALGEIKELTDTLQNLLELKSVNVRFPHSDYTTQQNILDREDRELKNAMSELKSYIDARMLRGLNKPKVLARNRENLLQAQRNQQRLMASPLWANRVPATLPGTMSRDGAALLTERDKQFLAHPIFKNAENILKAARQLKPCIICENKIKKSDEFILECEHSFHLSCIRKWYTTDLGNAILESSSEHPGGIYPSHICPICKKPITDNTRRRMMVR